MCMFLYVNIFFQCAIKCCNYNFVWFYLIVGELRHSGFTYHQSWCSVGKVERYLDGGPYCREGNSPTLPYR